MNYLECISLLNYLLKRLHAGQRQQVPVTVVTEVMTVLLSVNKKLSSMDLNDPMLPTRINDILGSINLIKSTAGLTHLSEVMKNSLVSGITELRDGICIEAYTYYQINEFDPTEQIVPIMRTVVEVALAKGVI